MYLIIFWTKQDKNINKQEQYDMFVVLVYLCFIPLFMWYFT